MSDFVEQCRREWSRLGVPDPLADEMAADLTADLGEAAADGISEQEFLGSSAFDPRSFATSWAAERDIIPEPVAPAKRTGRPVFLVAFTVVAAITVLFTALLLASGQPTVSVVASRTGHPRLPGGAVFPPGVQRQMLQTNTAAPVEWILLFLALGALAFAVWLWSTWTRSRPPAAHA